VRVSKVTDDRKLAMDRFGELVVRYRKPLLIGNLAFIALAVVGLTNIQLNDNFMKYFDQRYEIRQAADFIQANLTGLDNIEYSLDSGEAGGSNDPAYLAKIEEFANWYRSQPKVTHVNVITDTIKRLNENMHGDNFIYYRLPESRELAAQYMLMYEMSLPYGLDLNNQINVDKSATRMVVTFANASSKELRAADERARAWLSANAPRSMFTYGASLSLMFAHISERNIDQMLTGTVLALLLISGVLLFALRSIKLGLVSMIPNLVPAAMAFGIWGMFVGEVGLTIAVIGTMTLGIIVDDTVHFLSKYRRARNEHHLNPQDAVKYAFSTVGKALFITTIVLIAGFITLTFSGFKLNSDMGLMAAVAIGIALVVDFLFLPPLLMAVDKQQKPAVWSEVEEKVEPVTAALEGNQA
jgi:predicted RND superfamily exporter protein